MRHAIMQACTTSPRPSTVYLSLYLELEERRSRGAEEVQAVPWVGSEVIR